MKWQITVRLLAIVTFLVLPDLVAADEQQEAAIVIQARCNYSADCIVMRDNQRREVRTLMPLFAGDEVIVTSNRSMIELVTVDRIRRVIRKSSPSFIVPTPKQPDTVLEVLWRHATELFNDKQSADMSAVARQVTIDDNDAVNLSVCPALNLEKTLFMQSGSRSVGVAVRGGRGPFRLTILDQNGQSISNSSFFDARQLFLTNVPLKAGKYTLRIEDSNAHHTDSVVDVVERAPRPPSELKSLGTSEMGSDVILTTWWSSTEVGRWSLEGISQQYEKSPDKGRNALDLLCP